MENLDAIGGWRDQYPEKISIDATGYLSDGGSFMSVGVFRSLLLARENDFNRCLKEKLMTYALGRELAPIDRAVVDRISCVL